MTIRTRAMLGLALASFSALMACSSNGANPLKTLKALPEMLSNKKAAQPVVTPEQINAVLAATDKPASVFVLEKTTAQFILIEIERNRQYQTFGGPSRQSIVLERGNIVSTRGFGGDLISSEEGALMSLVRARSVGTATYVQRFLTSDNRTETLVYECKLDTGATIPVAMGAVNSKGTMVTANCSNNDTHFTNTYIVDNNGYILSGRQWMGKGLEYIAVQPIQK